MRATITGITGRNSKAGRPHPPIPEARVALRRDSLPGRQIEAVPFSDLPHFEDPFNTRDVF